jgi:hypothetical protein
VETRFACSGLVAGNSGYWLAWCVIAREGARYANGLKGMVRLVRLTQKFVGVVHCGVWVIVVFTCVVFNAIHQCGTMLLAREKQRSLLFVVDSPYQMIWFYSTTRMSFDPAKFLPSSCQVSKFLPSFELGSQV